MSETQISADDIARWEALDDIAASLQKRGLEPRPDIERDGGYDDELLIEVEEDRYIALINAGPGDDPTNYNSRQTRTVPTNFVATRDFETFSFIMRERSLDADAHGRITRKQFSFDKSQITDPEGERYSVLDKLNEIEYGNTRSLTALFDTRQVVDEFYEDFEEIRTDLVAEVANIPDDRGDAKRRFVQVTLNRLIFLHFIQEKGLLGTNDSYLIDQHQKFAAEGDVHEDFYQPLFFEALAQKTNRVDFDRVPYLNGGLFSRTPIEQEFPSARLGAEVKESAALYGEILEFLDSWNWHVDERLDVIEPKNLSPAVLGHIFEQTVNQKEIGAYYTPEEITSFMTRESIHPRILDAVNEETDADYDEIDEIFGLDAADVEEGGDGIVAADGGAITQQAAPGSATTDHVEALYFDVLKDLHVLDPAVGSGAFLLAAEDVLLDIYLHAIEYFQRLYDEQPLDVSGRVRDELDAIDNASSKSLYAKREIILKNLYGVDIDDGAVEICKLRLWLSMVADIEDDDPSAVDPLPNIEFNIRSGDSLIGFESTEVAVDGQKLLITERLKEDLEEYQDTIEAYKSAEEDISELRGELDAIHDEMQARLNEWFADLPDVTVEDDISGPNELREVVSASNAEVKLKLKFADPIDDDLDEKLNELGFRTWKTAANLKMGNNDVLAEKPEEIFEVVSQDQLTRSFVERGLLKKDIDQLDPFHWVMEFPDAYGREDDGFDVLLENPPYVRIESVNELQRDIYKNLHETATGRCDLYVPFIERSFELLNDKGRNSIITSNLFMKTDYGESIRRFLPQNYGLERIVDFTAYSAFDEVTIYSTILFGSTEVGTPIDCVSVRSADAVDEVKSSSFDWDESGEIIEFTLSSDVLGADPWLILTDKERSAREKVRQRSDTTLGDEELFTVGSPLKTGQNTTLNADVVAEGDAGYTIENSRISGTVKPGIWKRLITPDYVNRWNVSKPEVVTFFPYEVVNGGYELIDEDTFESEYATTYELLEEHKEKLLSRKDSRSTWKQLGRPWYSVARIGGPEYFEETKVVSDVVVDEPHFCIDTNSYLFLTGFVNGITPHETDPYYLTGLLNTQAIFSYLKPICSPKNNGYIMVVVDQLKSVPIYLPEIQDDLCAELSEVLEEHEGAYEGLEQSVWSQDIKELVNASEDSKTVAANMLREVSRKIITEYESLPDNDIKQLESVNDRLSAIIFNLDEEELNALYDI